MDREALEKLISDANSLTSLNSVKYSSKSKTTVSLNREKRAPTAFHSFDDGEDGVKGVDSITSTADSKEVPGSIPVSASKISQKSALNPSPSMTPPTIMGGGSLKKLSKSSLNISDASSAVSASTPSRLSEDITAGTIQDAEKAIAAITSELGMGNATSEGGGGGSGGSYSAGSVSRKMRGGGGGKSKSKNRVVPPSVSTPASTGSSTPAPTPTLNPKQSGYPSTMSRGSPAKSLNATAHSIETSSSPSQSRSYHPQPKLHPQGIDPRTGIAVVGSGGGIPFSKKMQKQHIDALQVAYEASFPAKQRHFHDESARVYHANTAASAASAAKAATTSGAAAPPLAIRPDGKIIWNTAPFFNKHNLTPRVNAFFGMGEAGVKRDAYIQRMMTERDRDIEDPVRDRGEEFSKEGWEAVAAVSRGVLSH